MTLIYRLTFFGISKNASFMWHFWKFKKKLTGICGPSNLTIDLLWNILSFWCRPVKLNMAWITNDVPLSKLNVRSQFSHLVSTYLPRMTVNIRNQYNINLGDEGGSKKSPDAIYANVEILIFYIMIIIFVFAAYLSAAKKPAQGQQHVICKL